jgi:uncharacterized protein with FMN-binding domain
MFKQKLISNKKGSGCRIRSLVSKCILAVAVTFVFSGCKPPEVPTETIDITSLASGKRSGEFTYGPIRVQLELTIAGGRITAVDILKLNAGPGHSEESGKQIPKRIIEKQDYRVDVVTGATSTSKSIMIATYNALTKKLTN